VRLLELNGHFLASTEDKCWRRVGSIDRANGVSFQCPKCAEGKEAGDNECDCGETPHAEWCGFGRRHRKGAHHVICWFRNPRRLAPVGPDMDPKPGRWWISASSTSLENLTFEHGEPAMPKSVLLLGGCNWHGYVTGGEATPA
jgi:hypothetical protein